MRMPNLKTSILRAAILTAVGVCLFSGLVAVMDAAQAEPSIMLEDFDEPWGLNAFGGDTGVYDGGGGGCIPSYESDPTKTLGGTGSSLRLRYTAPFPDGFSGLWSALNNANLQDYNAVSLWVRGVYDGGQRFQVGLKDNLGNDIKVDITDHLEGGITTSWQRVTIPFSAFLGIQSWGDMNNFSLAFIPPLDTGSWIYIDEIMFEYIPIVPDADGMTLMVDDYNDWDPDTNSLGFLTRGEGPALFQFEEEHLHRYIAGTSNRAKKITYNVNFASGTYSSNVWDGITPLDVSNFDYLSFRVKRGMSAPGLYAGCHLRIRHGNNYPGIQTPLLYAPNYFLETDEWQLVTVPLDDFSGLDKTRVQEVIFSFSNLLPVREGTLQIDNLQFYKGITENSQTYAHKPPSTGLVKIERDTKRLLLKESELDPDYEEFTIKGVGYQPIRIDRGPGDYDCFGSNLGEIDRVLDRDFKLLQDMGCNTIRVWNILLWDGTNLMDKASEYGIKVILGFWMPTESEVDYSDPSTREALRILFYAIVELYRDHPALLMWSLGNENNYKNGSNSAYYNLCNELAQIAYETEIAGAAPGSYPYHPVMIVNGDLYNIGVGEMEADDLQLNYLDVWGANAYHRDFNSVNWTAEFYDWTAASADDRDEGIDWFELYKEKSVKPIVITEYGADAFNYITGLEDETMQADFVRQNTLDIMDASDISLGGTLMAYSDEWWKAGDPGSHDDGPAYDWGENLPDGHVNEEWWGIMRVERDGTWSSPDGLDDIQEREVYYTLQTLFAEDVYTLTITPPENGSVDKEPELTVYPHGSIVTLTPNPDAGYTFAGWSGPDVPPGDENDDPLELTMDSDKTITATFEEITYTLTVTPPQNGSVTKYEDLTEYTHGSTVTLTPHPATGYTFAGWSGPDVPSGDENTNPLPLIMDSDKSIQANFQVVTYTLIVSSTDGGTTEPASGIYPDYDLGAPVSILAIPDDHYEFAGWSGPDVPSGDENTNPLPLIMDSDKIIGATFERITYTLTISTTEGGSTEPAPGIYTCNKNVPVSVLAMPIAIAQTGYGSQPGSIFTGWTGDLDLIHKMNNPLTIIMDSDKSVTATFEMITHRLVVINGSGSGTYNHGDYPTIEADTPPPGQHFSHWSGDTTNINDVNSASTEITMIDDTTVTAEFTKILTITPPENGSITKEPNLTDYPHGSTVTLTSSPAIGYTFAGWIGDVPLGDENDDPLILTMDSNKTIGATFTAMRYILRLSSAGGGRITDGDGNQLPPMPANLVFNAGDPFSMQAVGGLGYIFTGWTGDVDPIHRMDNPLTIIMDSNKSITANFLVVNYTLTVSSTGGGSTEPASGSYTHQGGTPISVSAIAQTGYGSQSGYGSQTGYEFTEWTGDVPSGHENDNPLRLIMDSDKSVKANFEAIVPVTHDLTIAISGSGSVTKSPNQTSYISATGVTLTPLAHRGHVFVKWKGDLTGNANPATIVMDDDKNITAVFVRIGSHPWDFNPRVYPDYLPIHGMAIMNVQHLSVGDWVGVFDKDGNCYGAGQYQLDVARLRYYYALSVYPQSIEDGLAGFEEGEPMFFKFYSAGNGGEINASPAPFAIYRYPDVESGDVDPLEINLVNGYTLIVNNGSGSGVYEYGVLASVQAEAPSAGHRFERWDRDAGTSTIADANSSSTTITVLSHTIATAVFTQYGYILDITAENGSVTKTPDKEYYDYDEEVSLNAVANPGYYFASWSGDITGGENPVEITMDSNKSVIATFLPYQEQNIVLGKGWNFIAFYITPLDPSIEEVFSSIIEDVEYIRDHKDWWAQGIGGSLTEISPYHSYYIKINANRTLNITGIPLQLPYERTLERGWTSISYPYVEPASAIGRTQDPSVYTGFFEDIMESIVWIKGLNDWCTPDINELELVRGKGIFIKLEDSCTFVFPGE